MNKIIAVVMLIMTAVIFPAYCSDDASNNDMMMVRGQLSTVDWVGDKISVRYQDGLIRDEIMISVPDSTKIIKGGNTIKLFDLHLFDSVKVEYYDDSPVGGLKAKSITVISW